MENLLEKINLLADYRTELDAKKAAFEEENASLTLCIEELEKDIKAAVLEQGETVKTEKMVCTYNKGRESWDGKILQGYAVAHPEILAARKIGAPTVSFRTIKK